jgi:hypothetical protein
MRGLRCELQRSIADVLSDGESDHMTPRVILRNVPSASPDDDDQLNLVIGEFSIEFDFVVGAHDARGELREDKRIRRKRHP